MQRKPPRTHPLVVALEVLELALLLLLARLAFSGGRRSLLLLPPLVLLEAVRLEAARPAAVPLHWPAVHQVERVLLYTEAQAVDHKATQHCLGRNTWIPTCRGVLAAHIFIVEEVEDRDARLTLVLISIACAQQEGEDVQLQQ